MQYEVVRALFQRKTLSYYAMKEHCFAGYQNVSITFLVQAHEVEYFLLWRAV
jgi:hypothetical protein